MNLYNLNQEKNQSKIRSRRGTVLLEILMATAMVGVTAIVLLEALIYSQHVSIRANRYARASQIASQEMEIIRATPFANLTVPYNNVFIGTPDSVSELPQGSNNLTLSYHDSPTNKIKKAIVSVSWKEGAKTETISFTSLIIDKGLYQ